MRAFKWGTIVPQGASETPDVKIIFPSKSRKLKVWSKYGIDYILKSVCQLVMRHEVGMVINWP